DGPGRGVRLDAGFAVAAPAGTGGAENQRVVVGIRPEDFSLSAAAEALTATVEVIEPLGAQTQMVLAAGPVKFTVMFNERPLAVPGASLRLAPRSDRLHLFDERTGLRLAAAS
ncbi:MAG: TOBE domain-containing protein, partial [Rhizobiales bacterium]|nr:TOBE domain-containing protein [Hyphomicrobiales bacterium]